MTEIFDDRYKGVVDSIAAYDMSTHLKVTCLLEHLDSLPDENGTMTYGTMAKALLELLAILEKGK